MLIPPPHHQRMAGSGDIKTNPTSPLHNLILLLVPVGIHQHSIGPVGSWRANASRPTGTATLAIHTLSGIQDWVNGSRIKELLVCARTMTYRVEAVLRLLNRVINLGRRELDFGPE